MKFRFAHIAELRRWIAGVEPEAKSGEGQSIHPQREE